MIGTLRRSIVASLGGMIAVLLTRPTVAANTAAANATEGKPNLVGTWKMVGATSRDAQGKQLPTPYGPKGMGLVTLNAEGRMMAVLCDGRPTLPAETTRAYASYCGNYTFDGTTLITRVDASSIARIVIGGDQVRKVRFEGKQMVLTPPPAEINGVTQFRDIFWERISAEPA